MHMVCLTNEAYTQFFLLAHSSKDNVTTITTKNESHSTARSTRLIKRHIKYGTEVYVKYSRSRVIHEALIVNELVLEQPSIAGRSAEDLRLFGALGSIGTCFPTTTLCGVHLLWRGSTDSYGLTAKIVSYYRHSHSTEDLESKLPSRTSFFYRASDIQKIFWQQHAVIKSKRRSWQALINF